jgi:glucose-6-phosphate-specific signal transduction histidine kinase
MGKSSTNATVILCFPFALQAGICMLLDRSIVMVLALWKLSCILIILFLRFQLSSASPKKQNSPHLAPRA